VGVFSFELRNAGGRRGARLAPAVELESGTIFAQRYRVEHLLARGGMGAVYVAQQVMTEARVALKVLDPRMLESESQCKAFKVEATVAARVRSQHIVRTLDAGYDDATGLPFLVMELLDSEPLQELVERQGPLPAATVAKYVSQIAAGLDRAHGHVVDGTPRPIIHRDLKPSNLMLTHRDDGEPEVKILDFGIAKILGQTTGVTREIKGTPSYMAFEQAAGESVTPQTDIWALGLIAFFLLTGKSYWRSASSPEGTLESLLGEVLALPLSPATERMHALGVTPQWPTEAFDAWFARCVHRESQLRFESAGLAAHALRRILVPLLADAESARLATDRTLLSQPPGGVGTPSTPPAPAVRARWPWALALCALLAAAALLWFGGGAPPAPGGEAAAAIAPTPAPTIAPAPAPMPAASTSDPAREAAGATAGSSPAAAPAPAADRSRAAPKATTRATPRPAVAQRPAGGVDTGASPTPAPAEPASPIPPPTSDDLYNRR
jgi:serine/threonine protein kinase